MSSCFVVTLNCAKRAQDSENIRNYILQKMLTSQLPEIIVFCLQEIAPISSSMFNYLLPYVTPFIEAVPSEYTCIAENNVGGTGLIVFSKTVAHHEIDITKKNLAFGKGWSSLKGASLITLGFSDHEFLTFISTHFAAGEGQKYLKERNNNLRYLFTAFELASVPGPIILAGDLNYRTTNGELSTNELTTEIHNFANGEVFWEPKIQFPATYKYFPSSIDNNLNPKRTPSWCDRILLTDKDAILEVFNYDSVQRYTDSDHKPVYLHFRIQPNNDKLNHTLNPEILESTTVRVKGIKPTLLADFFIGSSLFVTTTKPGWLLVTLVLLFFVCKYFL